MLYREITVDCSQIHTKHINTLCGQNVELFNVNPEIFTGLVPLVYASLRSHSYPYQYKTIILDNA